MVCDHVCALRGVGPDLCKSGPFAYLHSVQGVSIVYFAKNAAKVSEIAGISS